MKKTTTILMSAIFVFALAAAAFAAENIVTGDIAAIDAKTNIITVKDSKSDVTVLCNDKTLIMSGSEKKSLSDLKVGNKVKVEYEQAKNNNIAKSITIILQ